LNVTLNLAASASATPGNDTIKIQGVSGANSQTASFTLRVVQYRVVMLHSAYSPAQLTVTAGSTVFWQNLDGPAVGCGQTTGTGHHSVVFTTLPGANSSAIVQFGIYSYTFTTPGSYFYYSSIDSDHLMNGTITVTVAAGGVAGMMPISMPAFSYFKGGSTSAVAAATTTATNATVAAKPIRAAATTSPIAAASLALAGLVFLNAHSSLFSGLGFGAVLTVLFGVALLGLALAMFTSAKRRSTALGAGIITRVLASDSSQ
jgi:plastocyanin